ncbi:hypothetical protein C8R46DRAFT_1212276 [Mycena filopes]|nr:hypothetical protein C8R46DRAFT_1212276 [Mycena filopes]
MASDLAQHIASLTLEPTSSRSPSPVSSTSSSGSTEYFSDEASPPPTAPLQGNVPVRPITPVQHGPLYVYRSPTQHGVTTDWSEAAHATMGIPHATSVRLTPAPRRTRKKRAYVVFFGRIPGWYTKWDDVLPLVSGVHGALHQGYETPARAKAAYEFAQAKLWTGISASALVPSSAVLSMPVPLAADDVLPSALHCGLWYVVYCGITPGVYESFLECGLHTAGIRGSTYDSTSDKGVALARFERAHADHRLRSLPMPLYLYRMRISHKRP